MEGSYNEYERCSKCNSALGEGSRKDSYYSRKCLHRLCSNCYEKHFKVDQHYSCDYCNISLTYHDYIKKIPPGKELHDKDINLRQEVFQKVIYKRPDNFEDIKDYQEYLKNMEDFFSRGVNELINDSHKENADIIHGINKKYSQTKEEREKNKQEFSKELSKIKKKADKDYNPLSYYSSIIRIFNNMEVEHEDNLNEHKNKPIWRKGEYILIKKDPEKEMKAGGYDRNAVLQLFRSYSRNGLIS